MPVYNLEKLMNNIKELSYNLELLIYGRPELMVMKYCVLNKFLNKEIYSSKFNENVKNTALTEEATFRAIVDGFMVLYSNGRVGFAPTLFV